MKLRNVETDSERNFVVDAWLKSYGLAPTVTHLQRGVYMREHRACILRCLDLPGVETTLAVDEDDPELVLGFLVWSAMPGSPMLHYAYVKSAFRWLGISRAMLEATPLATAPVVTCTHWTPHAPKLRTGGRKRFNPYPFLRGDVFT